MPKILYKDKRFSSNSMYIIEKANEIIQDYAEQGYDLTLRQLYYQFVSRDLIPNSQKEYKKLGSIINDARLAGFIDWNAIVDRTRHLRELAHWEKPKDIISASIEQFRIDKWSNQEYRPEVWIEKDALIGVLSNVCEELDIPYFSCRGYTSQSEMWRAAQRLCGHMQNNQVPYIIHLGDHDPSGMDMSRDIEERLYNFGVTDLTFSRIALNRDQIDQYNPPPNPAKLTDSRCRVYINRHGSESWELDALEPQVIHSLIENIVLSLRDEEAYVKTLKKQQKYVNKLRTIESSL